jgi:hypothetical protein
LYNVDTWFGDWGHQLPSKLYNFFFFVTNKETV